MHSFDIICLSENFLDNSYHTDDYQLVLPGYNLIRDENPNNINEEEFPPITEKIYQ